jgi:signal peptidase II
MYKAQSRWLGISLGLVIGGALGNAIDRVNYGAVADFLDFHAAGYHWPAFNVADIAIFVGVVMLLFDGLIEKRRANRLEV